MSFPDDDSRSVTVPDEEPLESVALPDRPSSLFQTEEFRQLLVISVAFFFTFSAWHSSQNLQSSLSDSNVSGRTSLAITYYSIMVSSLFGPPVVSYLGAKTCVLAGFVSAQVYMLAQLFPYQYTVYPASALFGFSAAPLWVAQGDFTTALAVEYSSKYSIDQTSTIGLWNGIFFCIFEATQVVGNGLSSLVLHLSSQTCPSDGGHCLPTKGTVQTLFIVFIGLVGASLLLVMLQMRNRNRTKPPTEPPGPISAERPSFTDLAESDKTLLTGTKSGTSFTKSRRTTYCGKLQRLTEAARLMLKPRMAILIPLMIANGLARSFVFADFTALVVAPHLGVDNIGFAMMMFGFTDAIGSLCFGRLSETVGKTPIMLLGTSLHLLCLYAAVWGDLEDYSTFKILCIAAVWGIADGAWYTMIPAHIGSAFLDQLEAAFSTKTLCEAAAAATLFEVGDHLSLHTKGFVVAGTVAVGTVGFVLSQASVSGLAGKGVVKWEGTEEDLKGDLEADECAHNRTYEGLKDDLLHGNDAGATSTT